MQKVSRAFHPTEDNKFHSNDYVEWWLSFFIKMKPGKTTDFAARGSLLILYEFYVREDQSSLSPSVGTPHSYLSLF